MDPERVQAFFGDTPKFPEINKVREIWRVGAPVGVQPEEGLTQELAYGNHSSVQKFSDTVCEKAVADAEGAGRLISQLSERSRYRDSGFPQLGS